MSSKTKVFIIDDDKASVEKLCEVLSDYPDLVVMGSSGMCESGCETVADIKPDLLFLDIELPDGNGLDVIDSLKASSADTYVVVFTAYYPKYKEEAFKKDEPDYLLKPISEFELDKVIKRYRRHRLLSAGNVVEEVPVAQPSAKRSEVFTATTYTNELRVMRLTDIGFFKYSKKRKVWEAVLADHSCVQLKRGTSASDILRYSHHFMQTHQSCIVNMQYLFFLGQDSCRLMPPFNEDLLPIGGTYGRKLRSYFQEI